MLSKLYEAFEYVTTIHFSHVNSATGVTYTYQSTRIDDERSVYRFEIGLWWNILICPPRISMKICQQPGIEWLVLFSTVIQVFPLIFVLFLIIICLARIRFRGQDQWFFLIYELLYWSKNWSVSLSTNESLPFCQNRSNKKNIL